MIITPPPNINEINPRILLSKHFLLIHFGTWGKEIKWHLIGALIKKRNGWELLF